VIAGVRPLLRRSRIEPHKDRVSIEVPVEQNVFVERNQVPLSSGKSQIESHFFKQ
jgi:hypothetical protein